MSEQWQQGRTLRTRQTEHWTPEQWAANEAEEKRRIFMNFTAEDEGRSRICIAEVRPDAPEGTAERIAKLPELESRLGEAEREREAGEKFAQSIVTRLSACEHRIEAQARTITSLLPLLTLLKLLGEACEVKTTTATPSSSTAASAASTTRTEQPSPSGFRINLGKEKN